MEQAVVQEQPRTLTQEERNDLRKKVLRNEGLTVEEARMVFETLRSRQVEVVLAADAKPKRGKKSTLSDEQLSKDLEDLGL